MFKLIYKQTNEAKIYDNISCASKEKIERILSQESISFTDFLCLLSPLAEAFLEKMAAKAHAISVQRFGKTIQLYNPIYISNECNNQCKYCGFRHDSKLERKTLTLEEFEQELEFLLEQGFKNILLVSGENKKSVNINYLENIIKKTLEKCPYVSLEIYPLSLEEYKRLNKAGASGVTIYQETYHRETYLAVHGKGTKQNFDARIDVPDIICQAGYKNIGIGALLGLYDWRYDAAISALHAEYLMKTYWKTKVSLSIPRLKNVPEDFKIINPVSDKNLVQIITAFRIFLPDVGIALSTRESPELRDNLIPLGITQMSAGSKTNPGGYATSQGLKQFPVVDDRSTKQVVCAIMAKGYEPVWKDWDEVFNK